MTVTGRWQPIAPLFRSLEHFYTLAEFVEKKNVCKLQTPNFNKSSETFSQIMPSQERKGSGNFFLLTSGAVTTSNL